VTQGAAIVVEGLSKRFGRFAAVDDVSFHVQQGEIFGFLGPNGAGKTTTIRILLGLLLPTGGTARVLGYDVTRQAKAMQSRVGYMSQLFTLYDELTAAENLRFYGLAYGLSRQALLRRRREIIAMAGLQGREGELTRNLSGGWRQRLALGCAIIHEPELVFFDEPTAGVDPVSRREFWELIYELVAGGTTVFVTTHYMDEAEQCQRLAFISQGRIVAKGTPEALKMEAMRGQVLEIDCPRPELGMRALREAQTEGRLALDEVALYGSQIHVVVPDAQAARAEISRLLRQAGSAPRSIEWVPPSLEDVFIASVRHGGGRAETLRKLPGESQ
jgi:ABC-2 type transport system ATP-binding protein